MEDKKKHSALYEYIKSMLKMYGSNFSAMCKSIGITRNAAEYWKDKPGAIKLETLAAVCKYIAQLEPQLNAIVVMEVAVYKYTLDLKKKDGSDDN